MLLGHWLEMRSIAQARGALAALAELLPTPQSESPPTATEVVPLGELRVGDIVLVRPGGADARRRRGRRGHGRRRRVDDHRRVAGCAQGARRRRHRGHGRRRWVTAREGHRDRGRHGPVGDHATRRRGPGIGARAPRHSPIAPRPSCSMSPLAAGAITLVYWWVLGGSRGRADADRHRPRDRLPARAGSRDPAGDRHLDLARRPERAAGQGPARARASPRRSTSSSSTRRAR